MTSFLYHKLLGHEIPDQPIRVKLPQQITPPGFPELNESQQHAVRSVMQKPLSLIQGMKACAEQKVATREETEGAKTEKSATREAEGPRKPRRSMTNLSRSTRNRKDRYFCRDCLSPRTTGTASFFFRVFA
jgi:hypothetical protein